jgi:HEAT repeat protein
MDNLDDDEPASFPIADDLDVAILMHRDAHFGGKFEFMLDYYEKNGKGTNPDFDIDRIRELQKIEEGLNQNLAATLLSGADAERVAQSKATYKKLRALYEGSPNPKNKLPRLIADLILAEEEENDRAIEAVVAEKGAIVPHLMELLRSEDFHDSIFPGYGQAPALATKSLGKIADKRAIIALFETIGESDFFSDDLALEALKAIGEPAKAFLLKVLHSRPITYDNERAAMALLQFKDDPEVPQFCFNMLKELDLKRDVLLATHLILACAGLTDPEVRKEFIALAEKPGIPSMLRQDIKAIAKTWQEEGKRIQ